MMLLFRYALITLLLLFPAYAFSNSADTASDKPKQKPISHFNVKSVKPQTPNIPKEYKDLEATYKQYWDLFMKKDYEKAYKMECEEYRKANPYDAGKYTNITAKNFKLSSVKALGVEKTNEKEVVVKGNYYYQIGIVKSVKPFTDRWAKEDGAWKHVPTEGQFKK